MALSIVITLFVTGALYANPTGPAVVAGSASVQGGAGLTTIHQTSNAAIINWQSFSINTGETTQFIQPNSQSASLNRVLGGSSSYIDGRLQGNGQIFLLNSNGILIGKNGVVNVAGGFTASTRDISDSRFVKGGRHFVGHNDKGVRNLGEITSLLGNVVLIGKTVNNSGQIGASRGTVGLVAGENVLLGQLNADGSTITVNPSPLAKSNSKRVGVENSGSLTAASVELKAANGNIYSMAINNKGTIRATNVNRSGGHVWLTSDSGSVVNTGKIDVSATRHGGTGGSVLLKSAEGSVVHSGSILARGGVGGQGGSVDLSGATLSLGGWVDLRASHGTEGGLVIDPTTLDIVASSTGTITGPPYTNDSTSTSIAASTVETYLGYGNVTLSATTAITVDAPITWASNTLTFQTTGSSGTSLTLNASLSGPGLTINLAKTTDAVFPSTTAAVNVGTFKLVNGLWFQVSSVLAGFSATTDFEILGSSSFARAINGSQIIDIYGLQGIGSPSNAYLSNFFTLANNIDASSTSSWNGGAGFAPIGNPGHPFVGTFLGNGYSITGLTIDLPASSNVGLFGTVGRGALVSNLFLTPSGNFGGVTGNTEVGGIAGSNAGVISGVSVSIPITGDDSSVNATAVGGIAGSNSGTIEGCVFTDSTVVITPDGSEVGGIVGSNTNGGLVESCNVSNFVGVGYTGGGTMIGGIVGSNTNGSSIDSSNVEFYINIGNQVYGGSIVGGIAGFSDATSSISGCSEKGWVSIVGTTEVGGIAGELDGVCYGNSNNGASVEGTSYVGGIAGYSNGGVFDGSASDANVQCSVSYAGGFLGQGDNVKIGSNAPCESAGIVEGTATNSGGFIGDLESGSIIGCSVDPIGQLTIETPTTIIGSTNTGGFAGSNEGSIANCTAATSMINAPLYNNVGGFVGTNSGTISDCESSFYYVTGAGNVGGFVGFNSANNGYSRITDSISGPFGGSVIGTTSNSGGFVGYNGSMGLISGCNSSADFISGSGSVGGFVGGNCGIISLDECNSVNINGSFGVGGFAGSNSNPGTISGSTSYGAFVSGIPGVVGSVDGVSAYVGGFVGENFSAITNSSATFDLLTGTNTVGGFAGLNAGPIKDGDVFIGPFSTLDKVVAVYEVGGFVGENTGTITSSVAASSTQGSVEVGGFVGDNFGVIEYCSAIGGSVEDTATPGNSQLGGFVGSNSTGIYQCYTTESVSIGQVDTQVGGFAGNNPGSISQSFSSGSVTNTSGGGSSYGGFVGDNTGEINVCYTTDFVNAPGSTAVGGFSGAEGGTVTNSYSSGNVIGISPGGFIGENLNATLSGNYFLQDPSLSVNVGLPGIGSGAGSQAGVTPATQIQMQQASTYSPSGSGSNAWDFTLGSGIWGVNGYTSSGQINNGLPFFQYAYSGGLVEIVPTNLTSVYNGTPTGAIGNSQIIADSYTVLLGPGVTSADSVLASAPVFSVSGTNVNAGSSNQIFFGGVNIVNGAAEVLNPATLTLTPKPITVTGGQVTAVYGTTPAYTNDGAAGQLVSGDTLGGTTTYNLADTYSAGGYLDVGSFSFTPQITGANPNYAISYVPGTLTISPATLTYIATPAAGTQDQRFPTFTGVIGGLLPGDTMGNATTGTLTFSTSATNRSPAGTYPINGSGLSSENYVFVQAPTNSNAFNLEAATVTPPTPTSTLPTPIVTLPPTAVILPQDQRGFLPIISTGPDSITANNIAANESLIINITGSPGEGSSGNFLSGGGGIINLNSSGDQGDGSGKKRGRHGKRAQKP